MEDFCKECGKWNVKPKVFLNTRMACYWITRITGYWNDNTEHYRHTLSSHFIRNTGTFTHSSNQPIIQQRRNTKYLHVMFTSNILSGDCDEQKSFSECSICQTLRWMGYTADEHVELHPCEAWPGISGLWFTKKGRINIGKTSGISAMTGRADCGTNGTNLWFLSVSHQQTGSDWWWWRNGVLTIFLDIFYLKSDRGSLKWCSLSECGWKPNASLHGHDLLRYTS